MFPLVCPDAPLCGGKRSATRLLEVSSIVTLLVFGPVVTSAQVVPTGFVIEQVIDDPNLVSPIAFTELPDGRILLLDHGFSEMRLATVGSPTTSHVYFIPNVTTDAFERGVLGLVVDPAWPTRPYVYVSYTHTSGNVYITMYTMSGDLTNSTSTNLSVSSTFHLLGSNPDSVELHNGSTLRFGPDGKLYASFGDDGSACAAQDLTTTKGKILRLEVSGMPLPGTGPPPKSAITPIDNPFPGPDDDEKLVYAWGLRNPFRFTIDPGTGDLFIGDVGEGLYEEINFRTGLTGAASNFGWPRVEGDQVTNFVCGINNIHTAPIYFYPHGTLAQAVTGGPLYRADAGDPFLFPVGYQGTVFFAEFFEGWIRRLVKSGNNWIVAPSVPGQPSAQNWAQGIHAVSDFQVGRDGAFYLMLFQGVPRGLHRIRPTTATSVTRAKEASAAFGFRLAPNPMRRNEPMRVFAQTAPGAPARFEVIDVAGKRVFESTGNADSEGRVGFSWDGRDRRRLHRGAGVYFARFTSLGRTAEERILRVR